MLNREKEKIEYKLLGIKAFSPNITNRCPIARWPHTYHKVDAWNEGWKKAEDEHKAKSALYPWPDPKPEDLKKDDFNLIWKCIKTWDINVPEVYTGYCGSTGNHVMAILFASGKRKYSDYIY